MTDNHESKNVGRELTTEELNMVAGGLPTVAMRRVTFGTALEGVLDILVGQVTGNQRLINEGQLYLGISTNSFGNF
jgi:hypothetical protein